MYIFVQEKSSFIKTFQ